MLAFSLITFLTFQSEAQHEIPSDGDYYIFPIRPGTRNTLAGTMGELRSSHFHSGIDIRTGGVQGVPVQAAADGMVTRIAVSPSGYGNALYILHPNGETTVYAHLKVFADHIQQYVREQQYRKQRFQVNLFPARGEFEVFKGDTIALSGNSGSSGGPHVHFDIRDKNQDVVNPLSYNFEEIVDYRGPEVRKVALKTMDIRSRINNQFGRFEFEVKKIGSSYVVDSSISVYGKIGFELLAYDRQDGTRFRTGINEIKVSIDEDEIFRQVIENMSFSKGRNFYNHVNYEKLKTTGERFHKLYIDDGNELDFYSVKMLKGIPVFDEACEHNIQIELFDTYRNQSNLILPVTCHSPENPLMNSIRPNREILLNSYQIVDNTLVIYADQKDVLPEENYAVFYQKNILSTQTPSYTDSNVNVYLWDLKNGMPDSVYLCNSTFIPDFEAIVPSGVPYNFYGKHLDAFFSPRSLFDSAYLHIHYQKSFMEDGELFVFGIDNIPVRREIEVTLKPEKKYFDKDRSQVYQVDEDGNFSFTGGKWQDNEITFSTRNFGSYTIITDTVPPIVKPLIITNEDLVFRIEDSLSGIAKINLSANDDWVLMNYDPKLKQIWSEKLDPGKPFQGTIILSVIDNAGNENLYKIKLAEYEY